MTEALTDISLAERIAAVQERIAAAARRAGRATADVTLVAASKTRDAATVVAAYEVGLRVFGENRAEEAAPKVEAVTALLAGDHEQISWHMIGHIQSRKARDVVSWANMVHSVDSIKLARRLSEFAVEAGRRLDVLLEVNVSGEESKFGLTPAGLPPVVEAIDELPGLRLQGLMTMAPVAEDPEEARPVFRALRALRDDLSRRYPEVDWRHLSMGMTDDFEVAIEEGATMVRVGRAIFGERYCALR